MKKFTKIFVAVAALSLLFSSCVREKIEVGEPENDSYGVYFETLSAAQSSFELDPADEAVLTFKAFRQKKDGDITVPLKLTATIETEEGIEEVKTIFAVGELFFEDGQEESEFKVEFPNALMGTTYSVAVECTDREYVHIYSDKPTSVAFEVTRVKWNLVKGEKGEEYGSWTDDIFSSAFGIPGKYAVNDKIQIYEREDKPGYYRIPDVYNPYMLAKLFGGQYPEKAFEENCTPGTFTYIDATDPDKVYLPYQTTGATLGDDGYVEIATFCPEAGFPKGNVYGSMKNGVIKFPKDDGILITFTADTKWYSGNRSGKNVIVLPGCKDSDYTLKAKAGLTTAGKLPLAIEIGADVASAKYKVFEGVLAAADVPFKATEIARDTKVDSVTVTSTVQLELEKTGIYTCVVVARNASWEEVGHTTVQFSYLKDGDTKPVVANCGIGPATRYVGQGYKTDNTVEVWAYGEKLEKAWMSVVQTAKYAADPEAAVAQVKASAPVEAEVLEAINDGGYAAPVTGLLPGTNYTLVFVATNGYEIKTFVTESQLTTGDPLPVYDEFTVGSIKEELLPEKSEGYFGKYNFYAVDKNKKVGLREYISKVTIADSKLPDSEPDEDGLIDEYMDFSGMFSRDLTKDEKFDDTMVWDFYGGLIYSVKQKLGQYSDYWLFPYTSEKARGPLPLEYDGLLLGGFVDEGYIAIMGNPGYEEQGLYFNGIAMVAYGDKEYSSPVRALLWYTDLLLVEESKDDNGLAPSPAAKANLDRLHAVSDLSKTMKFNYVETPKGRARSVIDASKRQIKLYAPEEGVIFSKPVTTASYTATVVPGVQGDFSNNFSKGKSLKAELDALPAVVR